MSEGVMAALITGACSIGAIIVSSMVQSGSTRKLMEYQIKEIKGDISRLDDKVMKHNNLVERMAVAERDIESFHHMIDRIEEEMSK